MTVPIERVSVGGSWVKLASRSIRWQYPVAVSFNFKTGNYRNGLFLESVMFYHRSNFYSAALLPVGVPRCSLYIKKYKNYLTFVRWTHLIRNTSYVFRLYKTQLSIGYSFIYLYTSFMVVLFKAQTFYLIFLLGFYLYYFIIISTINLSF